METKEYLEYWSRAKPAMQTRLEVFKQLMAGQTELTFGEFLQGGDAEFKLSLDLRNKNDTCVIGLDFILLDADENGHESTPGVDVVIDILAAGLMSVGTQRSFPHSQDRFTSDIDEMLLRIENMNVEELAAQVLRALQTDAVREAVEGVEGHAPPTPVAD